MAIGNDIHVSYETILLDLQSLNFHLLLSLLSYLASWIYSICGTFHQSRVTATKEMLLGKSDVFDFDDGLRIPNRFIQYPNPILLI